MAQLIPVSNAAVINSSGFATINGPIIPAGNDIIVGFAGGVIVGPTVTDTRGNTYDFVAAAILPGAIETTLFVCHNNLALGAGDVITFTGGVNSSGQSSWGCVAAAYWNGPHLSRRQAAANSYVQANAAKTYASLLPQPLSITTVEREALIIGVIGSASSGGPNAIDIPLASAAGNVVDISNAGTPFVNNGTFIIDGGTGSTPTPSGTEGFFDALDVFWALIEGPIGGEAVTATVTASNAAGSAYVLGSFYTVNQFMAPTTSPSEQSHNRARTGSWPQCSSHHWQSA